MKILVFNGSPKGLTSVTVQYVRFLEKKWPAHRFTILSVCEEIKKYENDAETFAAAIKAVQESDIVLWATPVYVFSVPGPYKRFVELVIERGAQAAFAGKYAAILTTSVRFFDHTAHAYLHGISEDFGMRVGGTYSADMYDLVKREEQQRLARFWEVLVDLVENRLPVARVFDPLPASTFRYTAGATVQPIPTGGRRIVIVTDAQPGSNLQAMVAKLRECFAGAVDVVNLNQITILGGCKGCIQCSFDNICVYREADDVYGVYRKLMTADIAIEASTITDRFLSARWKTFLDRGFFNNHVPILAGKQIAYLISGPLRQLPQLRDILEASAQLQRANLAGIVSDQCSDSRELDALIEQVARELIEADKARYFHPPTFLGKAGHKVLRDEIWASLRFVFHRDHEYFKKNGLYDFPRRGLKRTVSEGFMRLMLKFPGFRKEFKRRIRTEMIKPLEKAVEESV